MKLEKSINKLLNSPEDRKRAGMYLGEAKITNLQNYIYGYMDCLYDYKLDSFEKIVGLKTPFYFFHDFIAIHYNWSSSTAGWKGIILKECNNDELKALKTFYNLFDEFKTLTPKKIIKGTFSKENQEFFNSKFKSSNKPYVNITNFVILNFESKLNDRILIFNNNEFINEDNYIWEYIFSAEKSLKILTQKYGEILNYSNIEKEHLEEVYEQTINNYLK